MRVEKRDYSSYSYAESDTASQTQASSTNSNQNTNVNSGKTEVDSGITAGSKRIPNIENSKAGASGSSGNSSSSSASPTTTTSNISIPNNPTGASILQPTAPPSNSVNEQGLSQAGLIAAIVGGVAFFLLLLALFALYRKKTSLKANRSPSVKSKGSATSRSSFVFQDHPVLTLGVPEMPNVVVHTKSTKRNSSASFELL